MNHKVYVLYKYKSCGMRVYINMNDYELVDM